MEFFTTPAFMVAGGALVASPILIHLINRMRFKRVRWAAMEFLLKSQKRNRRRLIIEQLILLALRCLLVLLVAFLVAEFVGLSSAIFKGSETVHVVFLDNTLSMSDRSKDRRGQPRTAFDNAKEILKTKIANSILQADSAQRFEVYLLTDPDKPIFNDKLTVQTLESLKKTLDTDERCAEASDLHVSPLVAVHKARSVLLAPEFKTNKKVFHLISDFRESDWRGPDSKELQSELASLSEGSDSPSGATVYLVDVADPERPDSQQVPLYNANIGITELRPPVRITAGGESLEFTVNVQNFTNKRYENLFLNYSVNGAPALGSPKLLTAVPPGQSTHKFVLALNDPGFNLVTAAIADPEEFAKTGIDRDNVRHTVVEVRPSVKILVIDGDYTTFDASKRDALLASDKTGIFYLHRAITTVPGYSLEAGTVEDLKKASLFEYPAIYLLNVPEIKDEKALANLDKYVKDGGSVCFFMGDKIKPGEYNRLMYRDGKGLFPVPLGSMPARDTVNDEEALARIVAQEPNLLVRDPGHPFFQQLAQDDPDNSLRYLLPYVSIMQYYAIDRPQWNHREGVEELLMLPNRHTVGDYKGRAQNLVDEVWDTADRYKEFKQTIQFHRSKILTGLGGGYNHLYELSNDLYALLHEPGRKFDPTNPKAEALPGLDDFWQQNDPLRVKLEKFYDEIRFGEPLLLSKAHGHGRVVACMTTAREQLNEKEPKDNWSLWPHDPTFPIFMPALRKYLFTLHDSPSLPVGTATGIDLDATLYEGKMTVFQQPVEAARKEEIKQDDDDDTRDRKLGLVEIAASQAVAEKDRFSFTFEGRKTGLYLLKVYPQAPAGEKATPQKRPIVYNVETGIEGELKRTPTEVLERGPTGVGQPIAKVMTSLSDFSPLSNRQTNLSESPWLYLVILIVLLIEQALAVHMGFHSRSADPHGVPQTVTPAAQARTAAATQEAALVP